MTIEKGAAKFSHHSLNRAEEIGLSCGELVKAWFRSQPEELSLKKQEYKFKVYGLESLDDFYTFDHVKRVRFTCHKEGKLVVIITVFHKEAHGNQRY